MSIPNIYLLNDTYPPQIAGDSSVIDHLSTDPKVKQEFFYNRRALDMIFTGNDPYVIRFSKISFNEIDMVPFFRYTTETNVNNTIQTPIVGVAPVENTDSTIALDSRTYLNSIGRI